MSNITNSNSAPEKAELQGLQEGTASTLADGTNPNEDVSVYRDYANCSVMEKNGVVQLVEQTAEANGASASSTAVYLPVQPYTLSSSPISAASAISAAGNPLVFPVKLHLLLTATETDAELAEILSWQPHGRAFIVHHRARFVSEVLSKWFLQSQFESFQRQLNLYGFRRFTRGPDRGAHYHPLFLRQKPILVTSMGRIRLKGTGPRRPANPDQEPNLYALPYLPALLTTRKKAHRNAQPQQVHVVQPYGSFLQYQYIPSMVLHPRPGSVQQPLFLAPRPTYSGVSHFRPMPLRAPPPVGSRAAPAHGGPPAVVVTAPSSPNMPTTTTTSSSGWHPVDAPTRVQAEALELERYFVPQDLALQEQDDDDDRVFANILADLAGGRFGSAAG